MSSCCCSLAGTAYCQNCKNNPYATGADGIMAVVNHLRTYVEPQTNADRIRGMSDEELAETYAGGCPNGDRLNCGKYYLHGGRDCFNCWLDWLKAPADKEKEK